jgi:tRNA 2-thiocytidine biosynthesis protein TtcA
VARTAITLLDILLEPAASARRWRFELVAVNLDQKQPGFPRGVLPAYLRAPRRAVPHRDAGHLLHRQAPGARGPHDVRPAARGCAAASSTAWPDELGATRIALGHHRDDMVVTLLTEPVPRRPACKGHAAQAGVATTAATSSSGRWPTCPSADIERYAVMAGFPIIPATCAVRSPTSSGRDQGHAAAVGEGLPGTIESTFHALSQVVPTHLLDHSLHDFAAVRADGVARADGDTAFDAMPVELPTAAFAEDEAADQDDTSGAPP